VNKYDITKGYEEFKLVRTMWNSREGMKNVIEGLIILSSDQKFSYFPVWVSTFLFY